MFFAVGSGTVVERRGHDDATAAAPGLGGCCLGGSRVFATCFIPRCHHRLLSCGATSFRDEADVCPRRMWEKGVMCPSSSSTSSSLRFRTAELFRRRGGEITSTSPPTCSGEVRAEGSKTSGLDRNKHTRPQDECRARGTAVMANGGVSNPASRLDALCSALPMRSDRGTGHVSSGLLSNVASWYRPFWGCGKGSNPLAAQRRASLSLGWVLSLRGPCCGADGFAFPLHCLSSTQRHSRVWEPRVSARPSRGCGSGAAESSPRDLGGRGSSPHFGGTRFAAAQVTTIPGGSSVPGGHRSTPSPPSGWTGRGTGPRPGCPRRGVGYSWSFM